MFDDAWSRARCLAETQDWLITSGQARALGATPSELVRRVRTGECGEVLRGVYLFDPNLYDELPVRVMWRAALLAHGDGACLVAGAAVRAAGVQGMPPWHDRVEVAIVGGVPRQRRPARSGARPTPAMPEVIVRQLPVRPEEVVVIEGLRVRRADLSVVDAALDLDRMAALAVLDSSLHLGLVAPAELAAAVDAAAGRPGIQQLRPLAGLADGRAESPLESRIRLICIDGGVPPDDLQYEVYDDRLVAVGDLAWFKNRGRPLLAEADGTEVHGRPAAVYRDRRRGNLLVPQNCDTIRFVWEDSLRPSYVLYVVRSSLAA